MSDTPQNYTPVPVLFQPQTQSVVRSEAVVPARVRVALEFLGMMTTKAMTRAAATEHIIQEIPGQHYWERIDAQDRAHQRGETGTLMPCPNCDDATTLSAKQSCKLCRGNHFIVVTPAVVDEAVAG